MKSRIFLHSNSTETKSSSPSGFLLARSPSARSTENSAVRRFELQHNSSPRFARRRQERHKGQALLLAVLIMLLAAVLSAGFLAVVSGNLNQSARIADKTRAIEASRAGIAYANAQLSGSSQGDLWRPIDVSPAPVPGSTSPDYNFYYSQLDKVQGWAAKTPPVRTDFAMGATGDEDFRIAQLNYRNNTYGKFPSPEQAIGDAPKFLVKVEEIPLNSTTEPEHRGEIKITSVGLSEDDPNVFHRSIAYKAGRKKSPWASALRSISNWDFGANLVPQTSISTIVPDATTGTTKVTVLDSQRQGTFPAVPFNVVLSHKDATPTNSVTFGGVVTAVTPVMSSTPAETEYTIAGVAPTGFVASDTMQIAAAIGTAKTIDLLNTGQAPTTMIPQTFPLQEQPKGILANGSLWLQGQYQLTALQKTGNKIQSSGAVFLSNTTPVTGNKSVPVDGDVATAGDLAPSSNISFPGDFTTAAGVNKTDLVNDAWNRLGALRPLGLDYSGNQTRVVEPFTPVKIDSAENLTRYRALTRNADTDSNDYKLGVYIDNRDDVEKVGAAPMNQAQLIEMLTSPKTGATATSYTRTGIASAVATDSLEQKHLRGWVGPDEFLARGALVEISPNADLNGDSPSLRVTMDARSDALPDGPDPNKAWRKADGTLNTGVYTRILPWPANGTLFAEGNLRVRGDVGVTAAPRSLTVVSLGNIYIEGSLSIDNTIMTPGSPDPRKKLMLLAKKNVIANPTRAVLARTDVQTLSNNTAAPVTVMGTAALPVSFDLPVKNVYTFNRGDYVTVQTTPNIIRGVITLVTATATVQQLSIRTPDTGVIPVSTATTGTIVRSPLEERNVNDPAAPKAFFSLVDTEKALNRRIVAPIIRDLTGSNRNKMLFDHVADLKQTGTTTEGLNIKAEDFTPVTAPRPSGFVAVLTNKQALIATTQNNDVDKDNIISTNKLLRTYNNFPALTAPTNQKDYASASTKTLTQFKDEITMNSPQQMGTTPNIIGYRYTATLNNSALGALPSYTLAGVGIRYAPQAAPPPTPLDPTTPEVSNRREDFNTTTKPEGFTIPVATSVEYDLNGTLAAIEPIGSTGLKYLGFNPVFGISDDALTVDKGFYQPKADILNSTLDTRLFATPAAASGFAPFPQSIVLKRSDTFSDTARSTLLPDYRVRAMKLENYGSTNDEIKPIGGTMRINAFVYAQEGSWFVIPGDYFRTNPPVRADINATTGAFTGSYIDYNNSSTPDQPNEYIKDGTGLKIADLNRNGKADAGELQAALRFVRFNTVQIEFFGAIVENQTAVVSDIKLAGALPAAPPLATGAVQDWMDKWASYNDNSLAPYTGAVPGATGNLKNFSFITYTYDPAIADSSIGVNGDPGAPTFTGLRIPVTDDLIYQQ